MSVTERQREMLARIRPLIEERGYDAVSVDAMAAAAGVAKATFYRVFPSKEAVRQSLATAGVAPRQLDARDGREAVLHAATQVFADAGYAGATLDAIAAAAGMSKAGVYWHFDGKEAVLVAVIERFGPFDVLVEHLAAAEARGDDLAAALTDALTAVYVALQPRRALFRVVFAEVTQNPEMAGLFQQFIAGRALPALGGYLERQMAAGALRPVPPLLAVLSLIGPLIFALFTQDVFAANLGVTFAPGAVVAQVVGTFLDGNLAAPGERNEM